ncbi:dienelactone hydrolase family protein [Winogradskyella sp. F6397]|uniref:Dienelactone hydrolase family protein n=1 Tax=Winogradskyella marina TaxID=2785530 RepID=A0ABS0EG44_9FLAO|nr:alpha/beta hydrolase [Winogradskyella marina]MBF8149161.1 dienelactone hydrolase family protein [Winogradskyella marina]
MKIDKNIILQRNGKKPLLIDAFYTESNKHQPIVIFCHGYKGFKDWGAWHLMAEAFSESGFCFIKFNFSHNGGTMDNPIDFPDLEAFGNNNFTKELDDLDDIITWTENYFKNNPNINTNEISLIGHSRGGGITLLKAAEDTRVTKLISLASVSDFGVRFGSDSEIEAWKNKGVKYIVNGRTKQQMPHYYQFFEDFKVNENRLHIETAAKQLPMPQLIIHGSNDSAVDISEAKKLHQWNPDSQLKIVEGANHVFNTRHPWEKNELSEELKTVINHSINFLK